MDPTSLVIGRCPFSIGGVEEEEGSRFELDQLEWGLIIRCTAFLVIGVVAVEGALIHHYVFVPAAVDDAGDGVFD